MPEWITDGPTAVYILGGLATFLTAIISAIVILRRLGPELSAVQVDSANQLVTMAKTAADLSSESANRLSKQYSELEARNEQQSKDLGAALARIDELEKKAEEVVHLRAKVDRLEGQLAAETHAKEVALRDAATLRLRVSHLEDEVARLHTETSTHQRLSDLESHDPMFDSGDGSE